MNHRRQSHGEGEHAEVVRGLERLADGIDRLGYPGTAWRRPGHRRRLLWPAIGAAAVAVAAALAMLPWRGAPPDPPSPTPPPKARSAPPSLNHPAPRAQFRIVLPAQIDPTDAVADLGPRTASPSIHTSALRRLRMPPSIEWNVPSIRFRTSSRRRTNHDS